MDQDHGRKKWNDINFIPAESPEFRSSFSDYVRQSSWGRKAAGLSNEALEIIEAEITLKCLALAEEAKSYACHWTLRNVMYNYTKGLRKNPQPYTVVISSDWQEPMNVGDVVV